MRTKDRLEPQSFNKFYPNHAKTAPTNKRKAWNTVHCHSHEGWDFCYMQYRRKKLSRLMKYSQASLSQNSTIRIPRCPVRNGEKLKQKFHSKTRPVVPDHSLSRTDSLDFGHPGSRGATVAQFIRGQVSGIDDRPSTLSLSRFSGA